MNSLYNHPKIKAHISFTHGEGFGRPLLEASLSGKPIIASGWSGHVDFLNDKHCVLLPGTIQPLPPSAVNEWLIKESQWFVVNYSIASQKMEDVFENYKPYAEMGERLRKENEQKFSLEAMDTVLHGLLDKYIPKFEKKLEFNLPTLKNFDIGELPKIELPTLKKVE
jgi:glycosyltransferase involved in cell wall biosynthesis